MALTRIRRGWLPFQAQNDQWRGRDRLELYVIACRTVDIEPELGITADPYLSVLRLLADAIKEGALHAAAGDVDGDLRTGGGVMTQVTHQELATFAFERGHGDLLRFANKWRGKPTDLRRTLYVGTIVVDAQPLDTDRIDFGFRSFNGSGSRRPSLKSADASVVGSTEKIPLILHPLGSSLIGGIGEHPTRGRAISDYSIPRANRTCN